MFLVVFYAMRTRTDIFPLAVVMGTFVIVSMVWLIDVTNFQDEGMFLLLALWLIGCSTAAGRMLAVTARRWREAGAG